MCAARIEKASKAIASVQFVCQAFEKQTAQHNHSDRHPFPSFGKDLYTILQVLDEEKVFNSLPG